MKTFRSVISLMVLSISIYSYAQTPPEIWTPKGIGGGGALFCPVFSPHNANEFYMCCDMGELFHTTDLGVTWDQVHYTEVTASGFSQVFFTNDPDILYVLQYLGWGYMPAKSTDGGQTWNTLSHFPEDREAFYLYADYNDPDRLIVTTYSRLYFSDDGGDSFTQKYSTSDDAGILLAGAYFKDQNIFVGTNLGLLVSDNGGSSFNLQSLNGIPSGQGMISFDAASAGESVRFWCTAANQGNLWAGITGSDTWGLCKGVYSFDLGTDKWINRTGNINLENDFPFFISCPDNDTSIAYLGGEKSVGAPLVMKTTNSGASWAHIFLTNNNENIYTGWQGYQGDMDYWWGEFAEGFTVANHDANKVAITDLGFIHMSTDGGTTWYQKYVHPDYQNPMGAPTPKKKSYKGAFNQTGPWHIHWNDSSSLFGCFTDIRGIISADGGETWSFDYTGHNLNTMYHIAAHSGNGTIYAATASIHDLYMSHRLADYPIDDGDGYVLYSTNGGADWQSLHHFDNNVIWVELDPNNPNRLYASVVHSTEGGIYVTNDLQNHASSTWTKLTNPPRTEGHPKVIKVLDDSTIVCTFSGRRTSGFTASSGVFVSTDNGASWEDRSDDGMLYWTQDLIIDPFDVDQNTWYVCVFSGWGGAPNDLGGLYRTTDRGLNWEKISDINRVYSCTFNPENQNQMFITSEGDGLWFSDNIRDASPGVEQVSSYKFHFPGRVFFNPYDAKQVWVASFGNGIMAGKMNSSSAIKPSGPINHPVTYKLNAYPNPFNPVVHIDFNVPKTGNIKIQIFNTQGRLIKTLTNEFFVKGSYSVSWDGTNHLTQKVSSGIYICRLLLDNKFRKAVRLTFNK
ncbi:MAG: T9SS type A sorting domain-containing protein [Calditrichaceae bacterium]|nr:T9SS type A sorting domain-containing protein [Calditrichaceae bacterium]MBN2709357.1 T9SS type A sorting domain-containing protein [Calditrichaceae bacterium]